MGLKELVTTLKKNEQKQIDEIWQQARSEEASLRKQTAEAIAKIRDEHVNLLASACQKSVRSIVAQAEIKARKKKLYAYQKLNDVLYATAIKQLSGLRGHAYENVFAQLTKELPGSQWEKIHVNPADADLAARFFNKNIVQPDTAINSGFIAVGSDGKIVVNNTFEKRLERKWPGILPEIIKRIEEKYGESESAKKVE